MRRLARTLIVVATAASLGGCYMWRPTELGPEPLRVVLDQLKEHAGTQFDLGVGKVLLRSDVLAEYAEAMRVEREWRLEEDSQADPVRVVPLRLPSMQVPAKRSRRYN